MTDEQLKTIHALYTDLWKLFKDYSNVEPGASQSVWDELANRAFALVEKYGEDKRQIVLDTLELIERNYQSSIKGMSQYKLDPPIYRKE